MGPNEPGDADDRPRIGDPESRRSDPMVDDQNRIDDGDGWDDDEPVELSPEDEDLVRTAFAAVLAEAIGDKGLVEAPSRSRQDRAQLVEVMHTDLHGREIEELHFIATTFGFAADIQLDPMIPEGHEGHVTVSLTPSGRSYV